MLGSGSRAGPQHTCRMSQPLHLPSKRPPTHPERVPKQVVALETTVGSPVCPEAWSGGRKGLGPSWAGLLQGQAGIRPALLGSPVSPAPPHPPGPSLSCFHWPRGVQACARLQQLLEWTRSAGFGEAGERFFRKLSCTLDLLATPSAQLIQVGAPRREPAGTVRLGSGPAAYRPGRARSPQSLCAQLFLPTGRVTAQGCRRPVPEGPLWPRGPA